MPSGPFSTTRFASFVVAAAGAAVAGYLTWVHYQPEALICTGGGGCERVQESEYAVIAGVPVAVLGLAMWSTVLALLVVDRLWARQIVTMLALAGLGFAAYLVVLQLAVIDAVCVWCMVNDVGLLPAFAALSVWRLRGADDARAGLAGP